MDTVLTTDISFPLVSYPSGGFLRRGIALFARFADSLTESDSSVYRQRYEEVERLYGSLIDRLCFGYSRTRSGFDDQLAHNPYSAPSSDTVSRKKAQSKGFPSQIFVFVSYS